MQIFCGRSPPARCTLVRTPGGTTVVVNRHGGGKNGKKDAVAAASGHAKKGHFLTVANGNDNVVSSGVSPTCESSATTFAATLSQSQNMGKNGGEEKEQQLNGIYPCLG